jgi:hypothetical protein
MLSCSVFTKQLRGTSLCQFSCMWRSSTHLAVIKNLQRSNYFKPLISRKVAVSIPHGVFEIFHWLNPSVRSMVLSSTQSLTEVSTRDLSRGVKWPVPRADNLATFIFLLSKMLGTLPHGAPRAYLGLYRDTLPFLLVFFYQVITSRIVESVPLASPLGMMV